MKPDAMHCAIEKLITPDELLMNDVDGERFKEYMKRHMCHELANFIMDKCRVFEMPESMQLRRGRTVRMEMWINDRGAYEYLLPAEFKRGKQEARAEIIKSLPYGIGIGEQFD